MVEDEFQLFIFRFLSTSPAWGTTCSRYRFGMNRHTFLSTSPAWGTTRKTSMACAWGSQFLSTSPAWGTTRYIDGLPVWRTAFLSTSPAWGTTDTGARQLISVCISIHVPRVGDDGLAYVRPSLLRPFLSTSPAWGTTHILIILSTTETFLSTSPAWGTTFLLFFCWLGGIEFLSTSPAWGTTKNPYKLTMIFGISIHVPRVGDDPAVVSPLHDKDLFLSTSPAWGTTANVTEKRRSSRRHLSQKDTGYKLCRTRLCNLYLFMLHFGTAWPRIAVRAVRCFPVCWQVAPKNNLYMNICKPG